MLVEARAEGPYIATMDSAVATRPRQRRMRAPQRRRQILQVAANLLEKKGVDGLRLSTVAEAAGVSKPVVYDHFPDQAALIRALVLDYATHLYGEVSSALKSQDDFATAVSAGVRAYFESIAHWGNSIRFLYGHPGGDPVAEEERQKQRLPFVRLWADRFAREAMLSDVEARVLAAMLVASSEAAALEWLAGSISRRRAEKLQVETVLAAVGAQRKARASSRR